MDEKLILKIVFVVVSGSNEKARVLSNTGGDIPCGDRRHLRNYLELARHGNSSYLIFIVTSMVRLFSPRTEANNSPVLALETFVTSSLSLQTV